MEWIRERLKKQVYLTSLSLGPCALPTPTQSETTDDLAFKTGNTGGDSQDYNNKKIMCSFNKDETRKCHCALQGS